MLHSLYTTQRGSWMSRDSEIQKCMEDIRESRLLDLDREKKLCGELLWHAMECHHVYGIGFAYTYLLDYYVQIHDSEKCADFMKKALEYNLQNNFQDLLMQVYNLCGIYYSYVHDDITAFENFLKSLRIAEEIDDTLMKYRLYNNVAVSFHNKKDYASAIPYYQQSDEILKSFEMTGAYLRYQLYLLENLINCSIAMDDRKLVDLYTKRLKEFLGKYPDEEKDPSLPFQGAVILAYYGRKDEAVAILAEALSWEGEDPLDVTDIVELYPHIFELLITRREEALSFKVLTSLKKCVERESPRERQEICALVIRYYQTFERKPELEEAYHDYYLASQEALVSISQSQIDAMKEKLASFEVQQRLNRLQHLSYTDDLCQIYNRRYYEELITKTAKDPSAETVGLVIVDIDYFKDYNDCYGHKKGDDVLKNVAKCLVAEAGTGITPCRYGGDEFCCVCRDVKEEEIRSFLERVKNRLFGLKIEHSASGVADVLTLSCGYSIHKAGTVEVQQLFEEADKALYWAKANGRNQSLGYGDRS